MEVVKKIDIFHSPSYDIAEPTKVGGALSLAAIIFCTLCFFSEIGNFRHGKVKEMVYLENDVGGKNMVPVFMDITIMELSCEHVSLDIQDGHGRYEIDEHHIKKKGDETTEEKHPEVVKTDTEEGGCQFHGYIHVRHMKGNFHFTPRGAHHHPNTTISHKIEGLRFGDEFSQEQDEDDIPLDPYNSLGTEDKDSLEGETHDYLVKLVRTEVVDEELEEHIYPYQYTYTHRHFVGHHNNKPLPPRIFFRLDFSPLTMKYTRVHDSFLVFISRHLALIGGTFAVLKMFYNGAHVAREAKFQ